MEREKQKWGLIEKGEGYGDGVSKNSRNLPYEIHRTKMEINRQ